MLPESLGSPFLRFQFGFLMCVCLRAKFYLTLHDFRVSLNRRNDSPCFLPRIILQGVANQLRIDRGLKGKQRPFSALKEKFLKDFSLWNEIHLFCGNFELTYYFYEFI